MRIVDRIEKIAEGGTYIGGGLALFAGGLFLVAFVVPQLVDVAVPVLFGGLAMIFLFGSSQAIVGAVSNETPTRLPVSPLHRMTRTRRIGVGLGDDIWESGVGVQKFGRHTVFFTVGYGATNSTGGGL